MTPLPSGFAYFPGWKPIALGAVLDRLELTQGTVRVFGRTSPMPRLTAWYGETAYTYSGNTHAAAPMPPWLRAIADELQVFTGARFNAVLVNYYRGGSDSVAWHADDEHELGERPTIASLSLGASRRFGIRRRRDRATWWLELAHGDLVVMSGAAQRDYLHSVPKTTAPIAPRLNLSFRLMV